MRRALPLLLSLAMVLPAGVLAADNPEVASLRQRLDALQANPATAGMAPLERMQAEQAIATLAQARRKDEEQAAYLARRRVEIAEVAARAAAARREVDQLDRLRAELLIEASRREAARARAELEQVRLQAQLQAEEAERLRQEAEAELLARQDAEQALLAASGNQAVRLSEAQQKAARLAREEAELVSGHSLPPSKFEARGEVFTLAGDAFASGSARLAESATHQLRALAEYLAITGRKGRVRIEGWDAAAGVGEQRARAIRDVLQAAGVPASRLQVVGHKAAGTRARSAEVVIAP